MTDKTSASNVANDKTGGESRSEKPQDNRNDAPEEITKKKDDSATVGSTVGKKEEIKTDTLSSTVVKKEVSKTDTPAHDKNETPKKEPDKNDDKTENKPTVTTTTPQKNENAGEKEDKNAGKKKDLVQNHVKKKEDNPPTEKVTEEKAPPTDDKDKKGGDEKTDTVEVVDEKGNPKKKKWGRVVKEVKKKITKKRKPSTAEAMHEHDPFLKRLSLAGKDDDQEGHACCDVFSKKFWVEGVVDPSKKCLYNWLGLLSLAVTYNLMVIIMRSVFYEEQQGVFYIWVIFDYLCDVLYLIDMFVQSRTAFLEQGLLVRIKKKLASRYVHSWMFVIDLISVIPSDFLYFALGSSATYIRLNRVLKSYRLRQFFQMMETRSSFPNALRILILIFYILVLCHWNACFYFTLSRLVGFGIDEWVYPDLTLREYGTYTHKFCYCFYRSVLMLTTIGDEMVPAQIEEYMFVVFNSLVGVLIFATIFGNVGGVIANMNADREAFQTKIDAVKQYMKIRAVGKDLEDRVLNWFDYTWTNKESVDDSSAVSCLPDKMKSEISIRVHMNTLKRVAIFQDCEPGLLAELVLKLKLQVFSPGDYVCRKGDIGKEMYIVKSGRLDVVSEDGKKIFVTLSDGAVFGEVSTLNIAGNKTGNRRTASVRSSGYSDLFCLNKHDLWDALVEYPEAKKMLWEKGKQILRKDNLLDEEAARRDEQKQQAFDQKLDNLLDMVNDLQANLTSLTNNFKSLIDSKTIETSKTGPT